MEANKPKFIYHDANPPATPRYMGATAVSKPIYTTVNPAPPPEWMEANPAPAPVVMEATVYEHPVEDESRENNRMPYANPSPSTANRELAPTREEADV